MTETVPEEVEFVPDYLTEVALPGEEPDRAFQTPSGRKYRAKVRITDRSTARPPAGVTIDEAAPTSYTITVSLAELDEANAVKTVGGKFLIFDRHELLVTHDQLSGVGFDIEAELMGLIERLARNADEIIANHAATATYLSDQWGLSL
jgi:hypothetical protein